MTLRLTKKRARILALLKSNHGLLSAKDIHAKLPDIDLVTIYRNLGLFVEENLISKVTLDADEAYYEYQAHPHHHAICTTCAKIVHFSAPTTDVKKLLSLNKFSIDTLEISIKGTCQKHNR